MNLFSSFSAQNEWEDILHFSGRARLAGVVGCPIGHTMSPALHNHWFETYQVDGVYIPLNVMASDIDEALTGLRKSGFLGVNVTLPHKVAVCAKLDQLSDVARSAGAVNTIFFKKDGTLFGTNTDGEGFRLGLSAKVVDLVLSDADIFILGAGGAARAIAAEMLRHDVGGIKIASRNPEKSQRLSNDLSAFWNRAVSATPWETRQEAAKDCNILINATSAGMHGQPELDFDVSELRSDCVVSDIIYNPLETKLIEHAQERGLRTVGGLNMLIYQAVPGFSFWGGVEPEVDTSLIQKIAALVGKNDKKV